MSMAESMVTAISRGDGWANTLLGIGGEKDPSWHTTFTARGPLDPEMLEAVYIQEHFAARIVEALPQHAMRPWWDLVLSDDAAESSEIREKYAEVEKDLDVAAEMAQGAVWGRLFGGALTWIGAEDRRPPAQPLDESNIETVRFFHTFDRRDVQVWRYYDDPRHPKFREPEIYVIRPRVIHGVGGQTNPSYSGGILVHESRCILWNGRETTDTRREQLAGWDDSVLEPCWDALKQVGEDYGAKSMLLGRISQAIYKLPKLWDLIAGNKETQLKKRMNLLERSRSRARAIILDTEEEFENQTQPLSGVEAMIDRSILRLAAAAVQPVPVLMGQSLASMQGDSEGALETWTQQLEGWRTFELAPRHRRLAKLILLSKDGPTGGELPEQWSIEYRALRSPTPKEQAEITKLRTETDAIRVDKGFASPEQIALARFAPSSGSDLVLDKETLEAKLERRKELENQPPKDNAELGTVGARSKAAAEIAEKVIAGTLPRESGKALLEELFRFKPEVADKILGPKDFEPAVPPGESFGPDPEPGDGGGAGAPQGLPGENDGGDPRKEPTPTGHEGERGS